MRKAIAILSMIFAAVLLVLSLVSFADASPSGYSVFVEDEVYGGDAYTGIQNAAADTARAAAETAERVGVLNNTLAYVGGGVLLAASFAFFLVSLNFFRAEEKNSVTTERGMMATQQQAFHTAKLQQSVRPAVTDGWKCTCGNRNPKMYATCTSCGKSAREVREQSWKEKQEAVRRLAEDRIVAAGVCPDCNGTLEKSDMVDVMMCPDCGRMFG